MPERNTTNERRANKKPSRRPSHRSERPDPSRLSPLKKRWQLARRELSRLRTEKTILLAILVQLLIASFSSILVVGFVSVYDPTAGGGGGAVSYAVVGDASEPILDTLDDQRGAAGDLYTNLPAARSAYKQGDVNGILQADRLDNGRIDVRLYAPKSGLMKTLVVSRAKTLLKEVEDEQRFRSSSRLSNKPLPEPPGGGSPHFEFIYTMLIPTLVFLPAFISGALIVDSFTEGFKRGTLELLRVAPFDDTAILDGKILALAAISPLQAVTWMFLLRLNGIRVGNIPFIALLSVGLTFIVVTLGASIAIHHRERGSAQFIYSVSALFVFSLFYLLPQQPMNVVAKISIESMTPATYLIVFVFAATALSSYGSLRWFVLRRDLL